MKKTLALLLAIVAVLVLGASKCEEGDTHPSAPRVPQQPTPGKPPAATGRATVPQPPDPHAGDPQPSRRKERVITVTVRISSKDQLPGFVHISTVGGFVDPTSFDEPIADVHRATFTMVFDAKAPTPLRVLVTLKTTRNGSGTFCSIEAGTYGNDPPRFVVDGTSVDCFLEIKRPQ